MGCGHSKLNIYSRRLRGKNGGGGKNKAVIQEKNELDEEVSTTENEGESGDALDDPKRQNVKAKVFGGPLLAQTEISSSQQDFFRLLDERIANGPDYNSESESERHLEKMRLKSLLKDWDAASTGSTVRSLPATPKRRPLPSRPMGVGDRGPQIPTPYTPSPPTYHPQRHLYYHNYPSAMQYQAISPLYTHQQQQQTYQQHRLCYIGAPSTPLPSYVIANNSAGNNPGVPSLSNYYSNGDQHPLSPAHQHQSQQPKYYNPLHYQQQQIQYKELAREQQQQEVYLAQQQQQEQQFYQQSGGAGATGSGGGHFRAMVASSPKYRSGTAEAVVQRDGSSAAGRVHYELT